MQWRAARQHFDSVAQLVSFYNLQANLCRAVLTALAEAGNHSGDCCRDLSTVKTAARRGPRLVCLANPENPHRSFASSEAQKSTFYLVSTLSQNLLCNGDSGSCGHVAVELTRRHSDVQNNGFANGTRTRGV